VAAPVALRVPTAAPAPTGPAVRAAFVLRNLVYRRSLVRVLVVRSNAELIRVAASLLSTPDAQWEIAGYTDSSGTGNLSLSQQRAAAVRQFLINRGVPAASLTAVGYGTQNPVRPNTTAAGRAQNRRVEIKRLQ
jgi:outer membrane protein OmpA-like peptidoglycan-associated protein